MFKDWLTLSWTSLLARGVIGIVFGIVAMVWPNSTVLVVVVLWGCWALLDGVLMVAAAATVQGTGAKVGLVVLGLVSLAAAFFALVRPDLAAATLTWFLGVWLLVRGIFEILGAFSSSTTTHRWVLVLGGVLDGAIGILFMANPGTAATSIAFVIGLLAFVWGAAFVGLGLAVRRASRDVSDFPADAALG